MSFSTGCDFAPSHKRSSPGSAPRSFGLLLLSAVGLFQAGCWDADMHIRRTGGDLPFEPGSVWSLALTRSIGRSMVDSEANRVPGVEFITGFGMVGCIFLDLLLLPFELTHDLYLLAVNGFKKKESWERGSWADRDFYGYE